MSITFKTIFIVYLVCIEAKSLSSCRSKTSAETRFVLLKLVINKKSKQI